ncbi:GGDEF domain-containing protein [Aerolutibacter daejeonensis]|uniref:GGDEF domain-containing protein n=1 Tax=Aerolutibacter daejeonensis TaxID=346181 RepID=UPI00055F67E8|nr:GGDEF domain-containing protein [Lysobacter daejeonensis]
MAPSLGQAFVCRAGMVLVLVAVVVLLGWQFDVAVLRSVLPGANSMKPLTAVTFLLAGLALLNRGSRLPVPALGRLLSGLVAGAGAMSLAAYVLGFTLASDGWYPDPEALATDRIPGRMSAVTATGFVVLGSLGLLPDRRPWWQLQQVLAFLVLAIAMFALASYGYQASVRETQPDFTPVAIHTALLFLVGALAWLGSQPPQGLMRVVHARGLGGVVARRLLLPALLLPSLLGLFARVAGDWLSWSTTTVVSMLALVSGGAMAWLIWWVALLLDRLEGERAQVVALHGESHTDALTGLPNRRAFDEAIAGLVHGRREHDRSFSLLMLDLDRFKDYNDAHGHLAGDEVLRRSAGLLRCALRPGDLPARYGGEEFGVLLPDTGVDEATRVAERIVQSFHEEAWPGRAVTISIGVAAAGREEAAAGVVGRADRALYAAKIAGRDRVASAEQPPAA